MDKNSIISSSDLRINRISNFCRGNIIKNDIWLDKDRPQI